jgi:group I intron endonuclease
MKEYYTYAYLREDRTPYYIGKGQKNRAYDKNRHRVKVPPKNRIIILKKFKKESDAYLHEEYMIFVLGRKDLGTGILINLSNGGDGNNGYNHTDIAKRKLSIRNRKKSNPFYGKKHTDELKQKNKERVSGKNNYWYGKTGEGNPFYGKTHTEDWRKKQARARVKYKYKIIDPNGKHYITTNLSNFCKIFNLNSGAMGQVVRNKLKHYKKWKGEVLGELNERGLLRRKS